MTKVFTMARPIQRSKSPRGLHPGAAANLKATVAAAAEPAAEDVATEAADAAPAAKSAEKPDLALRKAVALALWRTDLTPQVPAAERRQRWVDGRPQYMRQAQRLLRIMAADGMTVTKAPAEAKAGSEAD